MYDSTLNNSGVHVVQYKQMKLLVWLGEALIFDQNIGPQRGRGIFKVFRWDKHRHLFYHISYTNVNLTLHTTQLCTILKSMSLNINR